MNLIRFIPNSLTAAVFVVLPRGVKLEDSNNEFFVTIIPYSVNPFTGMS